MRCLSTLRVALFGLATAAACSKVERDFGRSENGGANTGGGPPACVQASYATTGTPLWAASTADQGDDFAVSCGNGTAPDLAVLWTAPASGWYSLNTAGSSFDTVLAVLEPRCDGAEIACNNNVATGTDSEIVRSFARGDSVLIVVDGNYGAQGAVQLNVEPVTCPGTDLTGQTLPASLTTIGGTTTHSGACGGEGWPEASFVWTPPEDGLYRFTVSSGTVSGGGFEPALYLERGAKCGGELLGCNATAGGIYQATVTRWLGAGQPVTIIVDSTNGSGLFTLDATKLTDSCPTSGRVLTGAGVTNAVLDAQALEILSPSCAPAASSSTFGVTREHTYLLHVDMLGPCSVSVTTDQPVTVYLLEGSQCDGREVPGSCHSCTGTCPELVSLDLPQGPYVMVVESATVPWEDTTYSLQVSCMVL